MKKTFRYSLFLFSMMARIGVAQSTWVGLLAPGNMSAPTNWSPAGAPAPGSSLIFPAGSVASFIYTATNDLGVAYSIANISITAPANSYTLNNTGANSFSIVAGSSLTANMTTTAQHLISMPIVLNGNWNVTSSSPASSLTISGDISGVGGAITLLAGQLTLSGTNTFTGGITIGSIMGPANPPAILTTTLAASIPSPVTNYGALIFAPTTTENYNSPILGTTGTVQMNGTGTWNLTSGTASTYTGGTTITQGTLGIVNSGNVGTGAISLGGGTLSLSTSATYTNLITLTAAGTISTPTGSTPTESGVISGTGPLTIAAGTTTTPSTIILLGVNTYTQGTVVSAGTLQISQQSNLGTGALTLGAVSSASSTLSITAPITNFAVPITLQGTATIDTSTNNSAVTLTKPITGAGPLTLSSGTATLTLSSVGGANTYTGGTTVMSGAGGKVVGDTSSIQGAFTISANSNLTFNQAASGTSIGNGTYSGVLTGTGTATLNKINAGTVTLSGASPAFTGATSVTGGTLYVSGSFQGSAVTVSGGGSIAGSGSVKSIVANSGGTIGPNGLNTLLVNGTTGTVIFNAGSTFAVNIAPDGVSDLLRVTNAAALGNAPVFVDAESGFYGFGSSYTILDSGGLGGTTFSSVSSNNSNLVLSLSYSATDVFLNLQVIQPFLGFPAANRNIQSVVNNINALAAAGTLSNNPALLDVIGSFAGQSFAVINNALDQLHPAQYSAFGEVQAEVGSQIISFFHRRPGPTCCNQPFRVWAEPYGNWLIEKNVDIQQGFDAQSKGIAIGFDWELFQNLILGFGGAGNHTELEWKHNRGTANINGFYGAAYLDYTYKFLYVGGALLAGGDHYDTHRHMKFTTIDQTASSKHEAFDLIGQFSCGFFWGPQACCFYPYINVDYFLLDQDSFQEEGASGLNLSVDSFSSQTIRTELGFGLQVQDKNYKETMCISPRVALGWTMEVPVKRDDIRSTFQYETLPFKVEGWDYTWQLFSFTLGLNFSYKCFTLGGEYVGELDGHNRFWAQRANFNLAWKW